MNNSPSLRFGRFEGHSHGKCAAASLIFLFPQFHGKGLCPCVPVSSPWLWAARRVHGSRPWWCRTDLVSAVRPIQSQSYDPLLASLSQKYFFFLTDSTCKAKKMILTQVPRPSLALLLSRDIRSKLSSLVPVQTLYYLWLSVFAGVPPTFTIKMLNEEPHLCWVENHSHNWPDVC